jgi:hypothetical protein
LSAFGRCRIDTSSFFIEALATDCASRLARGEWHAACIRSLPPHGAVSHLEDEMAIQIRDLRERAYALERTAGEGRH